MRKILLAATIVAVSFPAVAQQTPPANRDANTPAVNSPEQPAEPRGSSRRSEQLH